MTDPPPDILYVITDLQTGGVPLHLSRLARAMRDRGLSVRVASLARPGPVGGALVEAGIDVEGCDAAGGGDVRVFPRLARIIRRHRPRVIHAMLFHANLAARGAAWGCRYPSHRVLCEIQTVEIERRWHPWVDRWTHRMSFVTIGNSPSVIEHLHRAARIPMDRLRLVRGGIDPDRVRAAAPITREALGAAPGERWIMWVGRLDPIKGVDTLIEAVARLPRRAGTKLMLVGDGPMRDSLERRASALGASEVVRFLGSRTDVPALLKSADVFAFPSRTEGLPNALLEAMAAGRAIVTTDAPGCRDLIEHERTGLVVPVDDAGALRHALARLLDDADLRARLGRRAAREVDLQWRVSDMLDGYARVYAEAMQND